MRWTLGVQSALEAGDVMPPFPTTVAATSEGTDPSLENDRSERGQLERGDAALGSTESRQITGGRGATLGALCIYCGRALENSVGDSEVGHLWAENSVGDSEVGHLWATITCVDGEFVHASFILHRGERLACRRTDPRP